LPIEYQHDLKNEYIRIALITTSIDGCGHHYSPYKFQKDHNNIKINKFLKNTFFLVH